MRVLKARHKEAADFLGSYLPSLPHGGIFFPTRDPLPLGENVMVEIRFPELTDRMVVRGQVVWRQAGRHRQKIRAGVGIEFLAGEAKKRDFLLAMARGEMNAEVAQRKFRRVPVEWRVDWRVKEERVQFSAVLDDIGAGGAFLRTPRLQDEGTALVIDLLPPGAAAPLSIEARVAWTRGGSGEEGVGVEFRCRDTGGLRRLKELVRRLESQA
jgi:type IV pilus assembly protein PilZ